MGAEIKKRKVQSVLTPERLRQFRGLEGVSEERAREIIGSLEDLSLILLSHLKQLKLKHNGKPTDPEIRERKGG
jgi:hypothetical protein